MTAAEILDWNGLELGSARKSDILAAYRAADDEGVIQAESALQLFRYEDPKRHTTMMLHTALVMLGCRSRSQS